MCVALFSDPDWKPKNVNCTQSASLMPTDNMSPRIKKAKEAFSFFSITLLTIFIIEVCLFSVFFGYYSGLG